MCIFSKNPSKWYPCWGNGPGKHLQIGWLYKKKGPLGDQEGPEQILWRKALFRHHLLLALWFFSTAAWSCFNCAPEMVDHHLFFLLFHNRLKETFWPLSLFILEIFESLKNLVALSFYSELINHSFKTDRHFCTKSFSSLLPFSEIFVFSCCNEETIWLKSSHFKIIDLSFFFLCCERTRNYLATWQLLWIFMLY